MTSEIDDLLTFLEADRLRQTEHGSKIEKILDAVNLLTSEHQHMRLSFEAKFEMIHHQIAGIDSRVGGLERQRDLADSLNLESLHAQLKIERDSKQGVYKTIVSAIGGALVLGLGAAGTVIWHFFLRGK